jgi:Flp pilus assembly CpaE family ATPase
MTLVTCSAKHSPGASTLALALTCALASEIQEAPPLLIEADAAGGDLAARLGLPADPGLAALAAASRHGGGDTAIWQHANALPAGGAVVVAPPDPVRCLSSIRAIGARLATMLEPAVSDVVIDVGRIPGPSALPALGRRDWVLVACRPDLAGIEHTRRLVSGLRADAPAPLNVAVVMVGNRPYGPADATAAMDGIPAVAVPIDAAGVASLLGGPDRRARRTPLVRAARSLLDQLAAMEAMPA